MTTGMNSGAPFLETIAARGLIGLHLPHTARLPLFDGALDLIHSMHSVHILPPALFELLLYDWDRVLRPGGLVWLEFFYQPAGAMPAYAAALRRLHYVEHQWLMEAYGDGAGRSTRRLTAVLEKPLRPRPAANEGDVDNAAGNASGNSDTAERTAD
eukprot:SM000577S18750  [mRNA]  locus=s577:606:1468:- [translate_table: standard]